MDPAPAHWVPDLLAKRKHNAPGDGCGGTDPDGAVARVHLPDETAPPDDRLDGALAQRPAARAVPSADDAAPCAGPTAAPVPARARNAKGPWNPQ